MTEELDLGKRIKNFRLKKDLSLQELAQKTGLTKGYLSKIENTKKTLPVSTLLTISKALQVSMADIFGEKTDRNPVSLVKKKERCRIVRDGTAFGYAFETLAHKFLNLHMQPFILALPKQVKRNVLFQHKGEEMLFVLEGTMQFLHGENEYLVEEGDCIYFDASIPHYGKCYGNKDARCLMVIYTPGD